MRFQFDPEKSNRLRANPERGIGFEEARALFESEHITDRRSDDPEQFRAIGWVGGRLYSVIYPSCAENPAVQGGDVERGERSSPKLNSVSAAARCTGG
jgi:uncharacterized DUF497 family protein